MTNFLRCLFIQIKYADNTERVFFVVLFRYSNCFYCSFFNANAIVCKLKP